MVFMILDGHFSTISHDLGAPNVYLILFDMAIIPQYTNFVREMPKMQIFGINGRKN